MSENDIGFEDSILSDLDTISRWLNHAILNTPEGERKNILMQANEHLISMYNALKISQRLSTGGF